MGQQAGQMAFQIGGTLIGSYFGGPIGGMIGGTIGGIVGSMIFSNNKKPVIGDTQVMNSTYGNPIPILYGTARLPAIMIWQTTIAKHSTGFLKGGSTNPYKYIQSAALLFCEGPARFVKIFLDGKLFFDTTFRLKVELVDHGAFPIRTYAGDETQLPDYKISQWVAQFTDAPEASPAYRGIAYMVFDSIDLAYYGNRFPNVTVEWSSTAQAATFINSFINFSPDVSTDNSVVASTGAGSATDFTRGVTYQLSYDNTLRMFDLYSGQCLQAKTAAQLFADSSGVMATAIIPIPDLASFTLTGICCGNGGNLYISQSSERVNTIFQVDPDTFTITRVISPPIFFPTDAWSLICWTVPATLTGEQGDMLAGTLYISSDNPGFVIDPTKYQRPDLVPQAIAEWWTPLPAIMGNEGSNTTLAVSAPDPTDGHVTLYLAQPSGGTAWTLASVQVNSALLTLPTTAQTLDFSTWGLTPFSGFDMNKMDGMLVDPIDGNLILFNAPWFRTTNSYTATVKIDPVSLGVIWAAVPAPFITPLGVSQLFNCDLAAGTFAGYEIQSWPPGASGECFPILDTQSGTFTVSPVSEADFLTYGHAGTFPQYLSTAQILVLPGLTAKLNATVSSDVEVSFIITDLCSRVGITPDMIDVTQVTATTVGYVVHDNRSCGQALQDVCKVYQIDMVESDYLLKFVPRGGAPVATITEVDLGSTDTKDSSQFWQVTHTQEQEMPLQVNVKYADPLLDYQPGSAYARRNALPVPTVYSKRKMTIDLPVVVNNVDAQLIAQKWLYQTWASRDVYDTVLSAKYLWLDPTDTVTVNLDNGDSYGTRIESIETGADLALKVHLGSEDQTVYTNAAPVGVTYGVGPQSIVISGFARLLQFNVPLLQDGDGVSAGASRIYYAAGASNAGYLGGLVQKSTDGVNFTQVGQLPNGANYGTALSALPDVVAKFATDTTNSVRIAFIAGSTLPSSCAYLDLMNGANGMLLGSEVIQFQTVTDNADGTVTLSNLIRSRRGTDWATGTHVAGEVALLLQPGLVVAGAIATGEIGTAEFWELTPTGTSRTSVQVSSFTYLGYDLFPYAPINFTRTPSSSDLVLAWTRRTRIGGAMIDGSDTAPLSEETEAYEAYTLASAGALATFDPTNAATYVRKFSSLTAATVTYTAAEMTADSFTRATDTLYLVVYQLGVIGRGFQGYQALPAF